MRSPDPNETGRISLKKSVPFNEIINGSVGVSCKHCIACTTQLFLSAYVPDQGTDRFTARLRSKNSALHMRR
jgi:hypothetical protein